MINDIPIIPRNNLLRRKFLPAIKTPSLQSQTTTLGVQQALRKSNLNIVLEFIDLRDPNCFLRVEAEFLDEFFDSVFVVPELIITVVVSGNPYLRYIGPFNTVGLVITVPNNRIE